MGEAGLAHGGDFSPCRFRDNPRIAAEDEIEEPRLRVLVVDDDPLVRRMIRDALQDAGIIVIGEAGDGREAVELAVYYRPDIVVMDVVMPQMDGIAAAKEIRAKAPEVRTMMLSTTDDDEVALEGLDAGASGFLGKDFDFVRLPGILKDVAAGEGVLTPRLTKVLIEELRRRPASGRGMRPVRSDLTSREWEVLDLLDAGRTPDEIAAALVLSAETVRSHMKSLYSKLGVHSREELIAEVRRLRSASSPER